MSQDQNKNENENKDVGVEVNKLIYTKLDANKMHVSNNLDWLESRFHFRFADWMPAEESFYRFGVLHVLNDDLVQPLNGFAKHPHKNQEIFSYIIDGELTHEDSEGNKETLSRGGVQYMSAGTGVWHSEMNHNNKTVCRLLQTWIYPSKKGLPVKYGSHKFQKKDRLNKLLHMISGLKSDNEAPIQLHQDVNVYASELEKDKEVSYKLKENRQAYIVNIEGTLKTNEIIEMETGSSIRIRGPVDLIFKGIGNEQNRPSAHIMFIEMEKTDD